MNEDLNSADDEAMRRLRLGEDEALGEIMDRWQNAVAGFLMRLVGDREDALDLAQETFARVYEHRARYRPGASFRAWLFTIASNLARNHLRWRARHPTRRLNTTEASPPPPADPSPPPDLAIRNQELARAVRKAVDALPEDLRIAVVLAEYEDLSQDEIARVLRCSRKAVEMRLYHARSRLRDALSHLPPEGQEPLMAS